VISSKEIDEMMGAIAGAIRAAMRSMRFHPMMRPTSLVALTSYLIFGQSVATPPAFEVASVKPNKSGDGAWRFGTSHADITATNVPLQVLITNAYGVRDHQISGGPSWLNSERYDVVAKQSGDDRSPTKTKQMLQTLLADRFQLRLRRETKELPIYALVIGKIGPKLHEADANPGAGMTYGKGRIKARRASMEQFAETLGNQLGRTVVDKTRLHGDFAFDLEWTPDTSQPIGPGTAPAAASGPSIFTAVQEQLGLKLEPQKGSVEILVIDHVERPSEN
jgi:uncharacterized protein (TIGR03435 family)